MSNHRICSALLVMCNRGRDILKVERRPYTTELASAQAYLNELYTIVGLMEYDLYLLLALRGVKKEKQCLINYIQQ